jgi:hypothetical protein
VGFPPTSYELCCRMTQRLFPPRHIASAMRVFFPNPFYLPFPVPERLGIFVCWISLGWLRLNGEHRKFCFSSAFKIVVGKFRRSWPVLTFRVCNFCVIDLWHAALFFFSAGSQFCMIICDICGNFCVILNCYERLKIHVLLDCVLPLLRLPIVVQRAVPHTKRGGGAIYKNLLLAVQRSYSVTYITPTA